MSSELFSKIFKKKSFFLLIIILFIYCCKNGNNLQKYKSDIVKNELVTYVVSPFNGQEFVLNDTIMFQVDCDYDSIRIDSVVLFCKMNRIAHSLPGKKSLKWVVGDVKAGYNSFRLLVYYSDSISENHYINLRLLPDIVPVKYDYQVIGKYPHDPVAYTQGLVFNEGILYEGTGLHGKSRLRKVNINTGESIHEIQLPGKYFGEGITIFKDKIYQLTYRAQEGFVYDKETFRQIRKFTYQMKEGWGLTNDSTHLIMSDGSNNIYFLDPEYLTISDQIQIYDNKGIIENINEMEYVNGTVYANIYGDTRIVLIDPEKGNVYAYLDLKDLYPPGYLNNSNTVLNGIAYNENTGNLYVTGKNWPLLYEIRLIR